MPDLSGKVAIVTGAATGIGKITCETLARYGASVVVAGHSKNGADAVAADIRAKGGRAIAVGVDVTDEDLVKAMIGAAVSEFGGLDALLNNAGVNKLLMDDLDVVNADPKVWDQILDVNVKGPFLGCKYAIPEMLKRGGGTIVNVSSTAGLKAERGTRVAYGVSKSGLLGLTRHVANAYGKQNIRCTAIALGTIMTETVEQTVKPEVLKMLEEQNALARLGKPSDVAELVAFLFSDNASFLTGEVIAVDGGKTSHLPGVLAD